MSRGLAITTRKLALVFFLCVGTSSCQFDDTKFLPPKLFARMRTPEIIRYWGYPAEEHKVTTEDGYILTIFRIPNPDKTPVLFLHGLFVTSDTWFSRNPSVDIVFLLWKRGYDIWLWNARGNVYSREHVNLTSEQNKFYRFSLSELGLYDTTATIDYILNQTGHNSLITLGHSLGTTNVLIAGSLRPEYQTKVRLNILWAQSVFLGHMARKDLSETIFSNYVRLFDTKMEVGPVARILNQIICNPNILVEDLCTPFISLASVLVGNVNNQTDLVAVEKIRKTFPSSTSLNLSYGRKGNLKRYGTIEPPLYPIEKFNTPTAIYFACCNDFLSNSMDTRLLRERLKHVVKFYEIPYKMFSHADYLFAVDSYRLLYEDVMATIDKYNPGHRSTKNQI
ncbi:hypothetical protein M8J76_006094 [Diaphorina citri]|nr:hypothetical protein M8J76_006094 [Diaphorina citri]